MSPRRVKVFAASTGRRFGTGRENYGDNLMAMLLTGLFGIEPAYVRHPEAELLGVGSILDAYHRKLGGRSAVPLLRRRPWRQLHVWGSGFMNGAGQPLWPQRLVVHAVRGPRSAEKIGDRNIAQGDPAILLPLVRPKPARQTIKVAVVPHFATHAAFLDAHRADLPRHWSVVDLLGEPEAVTDQIAAADHVLSSSLHGLIVADAYGVPARRMVGGPQIKGDGFKYRDYEDFRAAPYGEALEFSAALRRAAAVEQLFEPPQPANDATVRRLVSAFPFA